jgi:hypothetical protein
VIRRYSELFVSAWFRGCLTARDTRSEYTKHPHDIHVYSTIRRNGCLCGCFTHANTLDCTTQGGFNHPRVSNDHAQSTAILGSVGKVDFLRRFCMRFQFFQIIPETVRRQDNANSPYLCAPYPTLSLKTSTEERGEANLSNTSRFTGHLTYYTQSRHLIGLQRMTARSPFPPVSTMQ